MKWVLLQSNMKRKEKNQRKHFLHNFFGVLFVAGFLYLVCYIVQVEVKNNIVEANLHPLVPITQQKEGINIPSHRIQTKVPQYSPFRQCEINKKHFCMTKQMKGYPFAFAYPSLSTEQRDLEVDRRFQDKIPANDNRALKRTESKKKKKQSYVLSNLNKRKSKSSTLIPSKRKNIGNNKSKDVLKNAVSPNPSEDLSRHFLLIRTNLQKNNLENKRRLIKFRQKLHLNHKKNMQTISTFITSIQNFPLVSNDNVSIIKPRKSMFNKQRRLYRHNWIRKYQSQDDDMEQSNEQKYFVDMNQEEKRLYVLNERIKEAKKVMSVLRKHSNGGLLPAADGSVEKLSPNQIEALKKHLPQLLSLLEDLDYVEEQFTNNLANGGKDNKRGTELKTVEYTGKHTKLTDSNINPNYHSLKNKPISDSASSKGSSKTSSIFTKINNNSPIEEKLMVCYYTEAIGYEISTRSILQSVSNGNVQKMTKIIDHLVTHVPYVNSGTPYIMAGLLKLNAPKPFQNIDKALSNFLNAYEVDPNSSRNNYFCGVASYMKQDYDGAKRFFSQALQCTKNENNDMVNYLTPASIKGIEMAEDRLQDQLNSQ